MQGAEASDMLLVWHLRVINQVRGCMPSFRSSLSSLGVYLIERRSVRLVQVFFSEGAWEKGACVFQPFQPFPFSTAAAAPSGLPAPSHFPLLPAPSRFPPLPAPSRFPPLSIFAFSPASSTFAFSPATDATDFNVVVVVRIVIGGVLCRAAFSMFARTHVQHEHATRVFLVPSEIELGCERFAALRTQPLHCVAILRGLR